MFTKAGRYLLLGIGLPAIVHGAAVDWGFGTPFALVGAKKAPCPDTLDLALKDSATYRPVVANREETASRCGDYGHKS